MNRTPDIEANEISRQLDDYLRIHGMRRTPERHAIVRRAVVLGPDFSVEELCAGLDSEAYHVSRTTVYNTVQLLVDAGILLPLRFTGRDNRYRFARRHADGDASAYLVCLECGKVKEVRDNEAARLLKATQFRGFAPRYQSVCVYGSCAACRRKTRRISLSTPTAPDTARKSGGRSQKQQ